MDIYTKLQHYAKLIRWDKPIGTLLILWPTITAVFIANQGHPPAKILVIFLAGIFIMRAAGDIINDVVDRKFDKHVTRTQDRPLTTGAVSLTEALSLCAGLLMLALLLVLSLNLYSLILAIVGVILTVIYPFMKRVIPLPQLVLGFTWSLGILMAFAASNNHIPLLGIFFYLLVVLWTFMYDTLYAMADREDDIKIGLQSSAIFFNEYDRLAIVSMHGMIILGLVVLGVWLQANTWFYLGLLGTILTFVYQNIIIVNRNPAQCLKGFLNNHWSLFFIFLGVYLSNLA